MIAPIVSDSSFLSLLPRKGLLALTALVDIACHGVQRPVSARDLASRHGLPPRHLEPVLQALVHQGILRGVRGPRGGYELARDPATVSAETVLRAAGMTEAAPDEAGGTSVMVARVVTPVLAEAERAFSAALTAISLADLITRAREDVPELVGG